MRATVVVFFAVFLATAVAAIHAETEPENNQVDGHAIFNDLSKEDASKKARKMAEADFARNMYRIFVAGKRPAKSTYDDYLKEKYGVVVTPIAGCIVSDGIIGAMDGYNSTMKPRLNRKFGHDIFQEAEEAVGDSERSDHVMSCESVRSVITALQRHRASNSFGAGPVSR